MSEADNLESLSNSEIRAKLMKYGLPNIPVTDSSRNVLIKKLRMFITGVNSPSTGSTKKTNRRETIATPDRVITTKLTTATTSSTKTSNENVNNRRTIAAGATAPSIPISQDSETPGKISNLRRSKIHAREDERKSATPTPSKPTPLIQERSKFIIVEDSDEDIDDNLILAAAEKAEKLASRGSVRAPSLTKSTVVTTSYGANTEHLLPKVVKHKLAEEVKDTPPQNVQEHLIQQRGKRLAGYSDIYRGKTTEVLPKYIGATATSIASPISSSIYPRLGGFHNLNEFSDEAEEELAQNESEGDAEKFDTPFLSNFAKNLERIKAKPLYGNRFVRSRTAQEVSGRLSVHQPYGQNEKLSLMSRISFWIRRNQWLRHLLLVFVLLALSFILYVFWQ